MQKQLNIPKLSSPEGKCNSQHQFRGVPFTSRTHFFNLFDFAAQKEFMLVPSRKIPT